MRRLLPAMLLALAAGPAGPLRAAEPPPALFEAAEAAADLCRSRGGSPAILPGYQRALDLNGDGRDDYLTDLAELECAGVAGDLCGADGCTVTAWLSAPDGGHAPFGLGELRGFEVVAAAGGLPAVRGRYAAALCGDGAAEACTRTWVFADDPPPMPEPDPTAASAAAEAPPPAAEPAEPLPPGWTLREAPDASLVALGGGTGSIASLAAFCLSGQPFLVLTPVASPGSASLALSFGFSTGETEAEAEYEATAGGTYVVALAGHPLAARLAGRDAEVPVRVDGREEGVLSLSGSTRSLRSALADCYSF